MKPDVITSESDVKRINLALRDYYGFTKPGTPRFRFVWSNTQTEKRFGVFAEFYGKIFIREIRGLQEVKKYPYIKDRWVLEQWSKPEVVYDPQIPSTSEGAYEPVWVFQHDEGHAVAVTLEVAKGIIWELEHPVLPGHRSSELKYQEKTEFDREVEQNKEILADAGSPLKVDNNPII